MDLSTFVKLLFIFRESINFDLHELRNILNFS